MDEQGRLTPREVGRYAGYLARLRGRDVEIIIRPEHKRRSLKANAYLWGVVYPAASEWSGYEAEEFHEAMKRKFLPLEERPLPTGEVLELYGRTRDMDTEEFGSFVNKVIRFLAEQGVPIPSSDEFA